MPRRLDVLLFAGALLLGACSSSTGKQGPAGEAGPTGPAGATGAAGPAGPTGATGAPGAASMTGATGPAGMDGMPGATGPTGPTGATGAAGTSGSNGSNGSNGATGATGATGAAGPPGPQGPVGAAGSGAYSEDNYGFAGFTTTAYAGGTINGRSKAHGICAAAFTGSHLCHASEYIQSDSKTPVPAAGAWMDSSVSPGGTTCSSCSGPSYGRDPSSSCRSFTDASYQGTYIDPSGSIFTSTCSGNRPLACCNGAPKTVFAGYTAQTITIGATSGGRAAVHALCNSNFAGSHLCYTAEYLRADSAVDVPASGAWIDSSSTTDGTTSNGGSPAFGRNTSASCLSFTDPSYQGTYIDPSGSIFTSTCTGSRPAACCF